MSLTKTIGRRLFARATMGAPLALKANVYGPGGGGGPAGSLPRMSSGSVEGSAKQVLQDKIWKRLHIDTAPDQEENGLRWMRRQAMGGLDPDLAVLNSMSVVRRIQLQIDRDKAINARSRSLRHRIIRLMGGDPQDFD